MATSGEDDAGKAAVLLDKSAGVKSVKHELHVNKCRAVKRQWPRSYLVNKKEQDLSLLVLH